MSHFGLLVRFDREGTDDHPFTMGFEAGRLWEMLKDPEPFEQMIHAENVEMVMRMSEATGRTMRVEDQDDEWCVLIVDPAISDEVDD